jgi:hypothetical protein
VIGWWDGVAGGVGGGASRLLLTLESEMRSLLLLQRYEFIVLPLWYLCYAVPRLYLFSGDGESRSISPDRC